MANQGANNGVPAQKAGLVFTACFSLAAYFILLAGAYFCQPNAEDISISAEAVTKGIWIPFRDMLLDFDGRYFTNLLHTVNPPAMGWLMGYKLMPVIGIVLFVTSGVFMLSGILVKTHKNKIWVAVLFGSAVYFSTEPNAAAFHFSMIGSFVYLWAWSFTFLWVGACIRYLEAETAGSTFLWMWATILLLLCAIGINEMFLCVHAILLVVIPLAYHNKWQKLLQMWPLMLAGLVGLLFFVTAPGILNRLADNRVEETSVVYLPGLQQSLHDYLYILGTLLKTGIPVAAVIAFLNFTKHTPTITRFTSRLTLLQTAGAGLLLLLTGYLMSLAYYIPMQRTTGIPYRIFSSISLLQLAGISLLLSATYATIANTFSALGNSYIPGLIACIALPVLLFTTNNPCAAILTDLSAGRLQKFNKETNQRYELLKAASQSTGCYKIAEIPLIKDAPTSIHYAVEVSANRQTPEWNRALEQYFAVDEVRLAGDSLPGITPVYSIIPITNSRNE